MGQALALSSGEVGRTVREVASLLDIEATAPDGSLDVHGCDHSGGIDDYRAWAGMPDHTMRGDQSSLALSGGDWVGQLAQSPSGAKCP